MIETDEPAGLTAMGFVSSGVPLLIGLALTAWLASRGLVLERGLMIVAGGSIALSAYVAGRIRSLRPGIKTSKSLPAAKEDRS